MYVLIGVIVCVFLGVVICTLSDCIKLSWSGASEFNKRMPALDTQVAKSKQAGIDFEKQLDAFSKEQTAMQGIRELEAAENQPTKLPSAVIYRGVRFKFNEN